MKRVWILLALVLVAGLSYLFGWSSIFSVKKVTIAVADSAVAKEIEEIGRAHV